MRKRSKNKTKFNPERSPISAAVAAGGSGSKVSVVCLFLIVYFDL